MCLKCLVNVRWQYPRIPLSGWGMEEDGSSWSRRFFPSLEGQMYFPACTDFFPGACPHSCLAEEEEASPEISASADAVWNGFPCIGCVSSRFALA